MICYHNEHFGKVHSTFPPKTHICASNVTSGPVLSIFGRPNALRFETVGVDPTIFSGMPTDVALKSWERLY